MPRGRDRKLSRDGSGSARSVAAGLATCPQGTRPDIWGLKFRTITMPHTVTHTTRALIIGAGPAGYTAAIYAARAGLEPLLVAGLQPGGQLTITTDVENYPGFAEAIQGPWLMEQMAAQAAHVGTRIIDDIITEVDFSRRPFGARGDSGDWYRADAVIIATGAQARWLGLPSEKRLQGAGVSACATCDGFFFRGKRVAVVGGGNTAVEEALYLTHHAAQVTLIHRRDSLRAEKILQKRLFANPKINVIWDSEVEDITGSGAPPTVDGVVLRHRVSGESRRLDVDGVFIAIGHTPTTAVFRGHVALDEEGYILTTPGTTRTTVEGVFAAGDVQDKIWRQAVTAAGTGCMAALEVEKYLAARSDPEGERATESASSAAW
jgi:thioredoxin reductase (NADPH)